MAASAGDVESYYCADGSVGFTRGEVIVPCNVMIDEGKAKVIAGLARYNKPEYLLIPIEPPGSLKEWG